LFRSETYKIFHYLSSNKFLKFLKNLTNIKNLIPDVGLHGGGLHIHGSGGKLNIHLDYSIHPKLKLQRKLNLILYLNPNAPIECGTMLLKSRITGSRHTDDLYHEGSFSGGYYDKTKFDVVDVIGNIYNRLIIMDAQCIHAASQYFGQDKDDSRLTHLFFFDNV